MLADLVFDCSYITGSSGDIQKIILYLVGTVNLLKFKLFISYFFFLPKIYFYAVVS